MNKPIVPFKCQNLIVSISQFLNVKSFDVSREYVFKNEKNMLFSWSFNSPSWNVERLNGVEIQLIQLIRVLFNKLIKLHRD